MSSTYSFDTDSKDLLDDLLYFNLEISSCGTALVINASKKGIEAFLERYGNLKTPPKEISFEHLQRPQRVWSSRSVLENKDVSPSSPTPYKASSYSEAQDNLLCPLLQIQLVESSQEKPILAVGCSPEPEPLVAKLTVNQKGWQTFLSIVCHLKDQSRWFYVTRINNDSWSHLPFQLEADYPGDPKDHKLKAIECVRLEAEKHIFLRIQANDEGKGLSLGGNSAGLLLLSKWLRNFSTSQNPSQDLFNCWNDKNIGIFGKKSSERALSPQWIYLRKLNNLHPSPPVIAFGTKTGNLSDCFIFCNQTGFEELADLIERAAFRFEDDFFTSNWMGPFGKWRMKGNLYCDVAVPEGITLVRAWDLYEGGSFNPDLGGRAYYLTPKIKEISPQEIRENFINERICHEHAN